MPRWLPVREQFFGFHDPVDAEAHFVEQLADDGRDFGRVDAVGAEERAAAALGALVGVEEELFDGLVVELAGADGLAEDLAEQGVVAAVEGAEQLHAQHRHVLGIVGAEEEVALVGTRAAAHADVHEELQGAVLGQAVREGVAEYLLPVLGKVPVVGRRIPVVGIRHVHELHGRLLGRVAVAAGFEFRLVVEPALGGEFRPAGNKFFRGW